MIGKVHEIIETLQTKVSEQDQRIVKIEHINGTSDVFLRKA